MPSPNIQQGTLNRIRGSMTIPLFPKLNVTAPFLSPEGINLTPEGDLVDTIPTMTGTVPSPNPYQMFTVEVALLKSQNFSDLYKQKIAVDAYVGDVFVRPDTTTMSPWQIQNCSIVNAAPGRLNGTNVAYLITIRGYWQVNSSLYDAA